ADEPSKPAKPAEKSAETPPAAAPEEPAAKPAEKPVPTEAKPAPPKLPISSPILTIKLAFMSDPRLLPYDIGVSVKAETVELSGKVGSEEDKRAAAEIAQKLESTKKVKNELHVAKEFANAAQKRQDEAITEYVRERFKKSTILDNAHFDVKTVDGIVSLSGKTRYQVIIFEAAEAARQVPGVIAVRTDGIQLEGS
ncbi:MAG TPA: BON domain-containing protein, partial [Nitrospirales bacterium]|nr:BON domain-containing protein [Nitrospirales bacterium]